MENGGEIECDQASAIIINDNNSGSGTNLNKSYEFLCEPAKDLIDVDGIDFSNDENWLYTPSASYSSPVEDLHKWLYEPLPLPDNIKEEDLLTTRLKFVHDALNLSSSSSSSKIDTRTFTRPKKRFSRPSIEKYNEQYFDEMNSSAEGMKKSFDSGVFLNNLQETEPAFKSADFDLSQPTSNYFDRILAQAPDLDSFQNMSPPSLVNSMCSSTFANLMESSFIKNDPILKEIVDTDFTNIIMQEEPQLYQSMTESCSSLTSDPEAFLKRVSLNETVKRTLLKDVDKTLENEQVNVTFEKVNGLSEDEIETELSPNATFERKTDSTFTTIQTTPTNHGTYRRPSKLSSHTFRKSDKIDIMRNNTFKKSDRDTTYINTSNSSEEKIDDDIDDDILEKKRLSDATFEMNDTNRLVYENNEKLNGTFNTNERNKDIKDNNKRSSMIGSTGSADSLDRMSSISNSSSKGSNKMLNFSDVDAIVQMQEKSLQQVMSTPKPHKNAHNFLDTKCISPINHYYESDSSSCEEFKLPAAQQQFVKPNGLKMPPPNNVRGSHGNLVQMHKLSGAGSQSQLSRPKSSNLHRMGQNLKGSYTSLKPISANLPEAPPLETKVNGTMTVTRSVNVTRTMEVKQIKTTTSEPIIAKPQVRSGLPRPVGASTGIPRPTSRIPGPKSNIRPPTRPTRQMTDG